VTDQETGQTITKALDELNEKDVANLEKMANTAPKTMEELAKDQLSTTQAMAADIASMADKTGLGLAGGKTMTGLQKFSRASATSVAKVMSPKEMESKNLRGSIDSGVDKNLDIIKRLSEGKITKGEASKELGTSLKDLNSFISKSIETSRKNAGVESEKIKKDFPFVEQLQQVLSGDIRGTANIKKQSSDANPANVKRNIGSVRNASATPTNTQSNNAAPNKPIEITLNHNIDLKTNGNIDTNQVVQAFKNTDVQQGMVNALKEAMYSNGLLAPTSNKTQLMNPNLSNK